MQVYLVGGAIRDQLLGCAPRERDWVVTGATPEEMRALGYRAVGRDFPVFLHPQSNEEYALARLERKVAPGYRGFVTEFSPAVTLEQDLQRRDLTINAMAQRADGTLIDPFGGRADLERRVLRHVSPAFAEDPVRILRVARFAARLAPLGFTVAPETLELMRAMVRVGEAAALVPERVWRELERALGEPQPLAFFATLAACGALQVVLPELAAACAPRAGGAPAPAALALTAAAAAARTPPVRLAALAGGLDEPQIEALCARLRAPGDYRELLLLAARLRTLLGGDAPPPLQRLRDPDWLLGLLEATDALRRPERFSAALQVLVARAAGAGASSQDAAHLADALGAAARRAGTVRLDPAEIATLPGPRIAARLRELRRAALDATPPLTTAGAADPAA
jgi:tRNA nucleotidyltransferase (CCA-adding enzyme)